MGKPKRDYKADLCYYLANVLIPYGIGWELHAEYRFHPTRKWRFDYCWEEPMIAIEYDGIMFRTVGHNSLDGILRDSEKINEAQRLGWRVFRANAKNVGDGTFFALMDDVLEREVKGEAA